MFHTILNYVGNNMTAEKFLALMIMVLFMAPFSIAGSHLIFGKLAERYINRRNRKQIREYAELRIRAKRGERNE